MTNPIGDRIHWRDGDYQLSQCSVCRHKTPGAATCAAFPASIPNEILANEVSHEAPLGTEGSVLEPIEIARPLFERMTRLQWPAGAVSYTDVEELLRRVGAGEDLQDELDRALWSADLLLPRTEESGLAPDQVGLTPIDTPDGVTGLPFFTSYPKLAAWAGPLAHWVRCRFDNFEDDLWHEFPAIVNPGDRVQLVVDPRAIRPRAD